MRQKSGPDKAPAEQVVKDIRRATRRQFSAEEKIRIVLEGVRGEESIAELCRREGIASSMYYGWSKEFLDAGKKRLAGDTARAATSDEVKDLRREAQAFVEGARGRSDPGEPSAEKKHDRGWGRPGMRYPAAEKVEIIRLWSRPPICRHAGRSRSSASRGRPFIDGTTATGTTARRRPVTGAPVPIASGTGYPRRSGTRSSTWRSPCPNSAHANWRCASPMRKSTSSRRPRSIDC